MTTAKKNGLKRAYDFFVMPLYSFFKDLIVACKGRRLTVLWIAAIFAALYVGSDTYAKKIKDKFGVAIDISNISSNDHIFFTIDKNAKTYDQLKKGEYVAFSSSLLEPFVPKGATIVKKIVGKQGDHIRIQNGVVFINGEQLAQLHPIALQKLKKTKDQMNADYIIPDNHLFILGSYERSYDSRYWGLLPLNTDEKIGIATPFLL